MKEKVRLRGKWTYRRRHGSPSHKIPKEKIKTRKGRPEKQPHIQNKFSYQNKKQWLENSR
jgi:hypothetical protein